MSSRLALAYQLCSQCLCMALAVTAGQQGCHDVYLFGTSMPPVVEPGRDLQWICTARCCQGIWGCKLLMQQKTQLLPSAYAKQGEQDSEQDKLHTPATCKQSWHSTFWCLIGVKSRARQDSSQCRPNWSVHRTHLLCLGSSGTISILFIQGIHLII